LVPLILESKRLKLYQCDDKILKAIIKGNDSLSKYLGVIAEPGWTEFGEVIFEFTLKKILEDPDNAKWGVFLPILKTENRVIGTCGYKGKPDGNGCVEIGYEVSVSYRNQGYAREVTDLLVDHAYNNGALKVVAHTLEKDNASAQVLIRNGFQFISSVQDPEDGVVWKWEKPKG
jgi:RimJ/RimL family protein N-acetyltransferase